MARYLTKAGILIGLTLLLVAVIAALLPVTAAEAASYDTERYFENLSLFGKKFTLYFTAPAGHTVTRVELLEVKSSGGGAGAHEEQPGIRCWMNALSALRIKIRVHYESS